MDRIDAATAALPLQDETSAARPLGDLWKDRTAVVVFLRHFG